jgi:hypothetical protein
MRPADRCAVRAIPPAPPSGTRRLPTLLPGPGPRPDCRNEAECLGRWVRAHPVGKGHTDGPAHCPPFCSHLEPIPEHHGLAAAHYYAGGGERLCPANGFSEMDDTDEDPRT